MLYPLYVHKDEGSAYGGTFPDFPGCFTGADELEGLPQAAQEAVELYFDGEDMDVPKPRAIEVVAADPEYAGGFWLLVDIDLAKINNKAMRLNISLPANLVHEIDDFASSHGMSRSGFLASAAQRAIHAARGMPESFEPEC